MHFMHMAGAEVLVREIIHQLGPLIDPTVICLDTVDQIGEQLRSEGVRVEWMNRKPGRDYFVGWKIAALIRERRIQVLHAHQYTPFFYAALGKVLALSRCRIILTEHGRHLLRNERAEEGLLALRESLRLQPRLARYRLDTVVLIFHGLGATGRYDELREHSDFWLSIVQRFSRRHRYPSLLRSLHGYWTEAGDEERVREIQELLSRPAR